MEFIQSLRISFYPTSFPEPLSYLEGGEAQSLPHIQTPGEFHSEGRSCLRPGHSSRHKGSLQQNQTGQRPGQGQVEELPPPSPRAGGGPEGSGGGWWLPSLDATQPHPKGQEAVAQMASHTSLRSKSRTESGTTGAQGSRNLFLRMRTLPDHSKKKKEVSG